MLEVNMGIHLVVGEQDGGKKKDCRNQGILDQVYLNGNFGKLPTFLPVLLQVFFPFIYINNFLNLLSGFTKILGGVFPQNKKN